ncbi:MAG TPA: hypothetical protein VK632_12550 [Verrucomicrobiae bacterium]|nr:hypothetical protein [Verrucomicrobiae bacterium]
MSDLKDYANIFDGIKPFKGQVPKGFIVDFLGVLTDANFRSMWGVDPKAVGGHVVETTVPPVEHGEGWFEAANWVMAARDAKEKFVMVTLGACYGSQAVGAYRAIQTLNPMPCKLVAVEPEPGNIEWMKRHMLDNGIDPDDHWLVGSAISDRNEPVLFPVGSPGSGAQNCFSTNENAAREFYVKEIVSSGNVEDALRNLLLHNNTGIKKDLVPGSNYNFMAEIKMMSAVTLKDILSPFDVVDFVESDIQQSEILVFPPFFDLLKKKVRRIHIGTHGAEVHATLLGLFEKDGWEIVFDFAPNKTHTSALGSFVTNDGVLSVRNPTL